MRTKTHWAFAALAAAGLALAGCGGGGSSSSMMTPPMQQPHVCEAGASQACVDARQAELDALGADASKAEHDAAEAALAAAQMALASKNAAEARQTLVAAAACTEATPACVAAHDALIAALQADLAALQADDNATNAQVQAAQMALAAAQTARSAVSMALAEIDRSTATGSAVGAAVDAANALEDARSADEIAAAEALLATAKGMLTDADDYAAQIMAAEMAIARAKERNSVDAAVMAAENAATGLADDAGEAAVTAAQALIAAANMAIEDAEHLTDAEKAAQTAKVTAAQGTVTVAQNAIDVAKALADAEAERKAQAEAEAKAKADAAAGKALKAALGNTPLNYAPALTAGITSRGVTLSYNHDQDDGTTAVESTGRLPPGESVGSLDGWSGTNYARTNPGTKVTNVAVIYTNRAAAKSYPIATRYATATNVPAGAGAYTPATRTLAIAAATADTNIKGALFPTAGEKVFAATSPSDEILVPGTYQGASGSYRCTGAIGTCRATAETNGVISLSDAWVFVHDMGASVSISDSNYLYFGWWLQKDKDDEPDYASAFTGVQGSIAGDGTTALATNPNALAGSATYSGGAAGKFAISDPLSGGNAGHFTADATLSATFGVGATAGLSGTLDNFMANDEVVPWSVTLFRSAWDGTTAGATTPVDNASTATVDESVTQTVWSIDGNSAAASGTWGAQMYDEKPENPPTGDGSNVPTSVTGTFQSHFGSTHTMVGAFGATAD